MKLFDVYPLMSFEPVKARGSWLWDTEGNKYLDLYGGHAVISIGHSHPHYVASLCSQLEKIGFYSNSVINSLQERLAERLGQISNYPDNKLFLCNSGAEANENALKLASFHTGRKKVIAFDKSFHGRTSLAVAATHDSSIQAPVNQTHEVVTLPLNDFEAFERTMDDTFAAVIVEGIQGVGGIRVPGSEFLQLLRKKCDETGTVLILDEVQSGYGRTGKFFAHQHCGIKADIISMAKGMGNGFPVGGILISPAFKEKHGLLGTTFGGNHLACAAAIAVLEVIENEKLISAAAKSGEYLKSEFSKMDSIKEVRGEGLMVGLEFDFPIAELKNTLYKEHKILVGTSSNKNTLRLLPALNISPEELDLAVTAISAAVTSQQKAIEI